jgi:hypothetical protein
MAAWRKTVRNIVILHELETTYPVRDAAPARGASEAAAVPYAGINRIRFEGLLSGRVATPRQHVYF